MRLPTPVPVRVTARLLAATAAAAVLLAGCTTTGADEGTKTGAAQGVVGGQNSLTQVPPDQRKPAPVVSGPALGTDKTISTGDYAGKVIVVNTWGSWCGPCRLEAKDLQQASVQTAKTAQFIGINTRDPDPANAEAFTRAFGITYPSIYDNEGKVLLNYSGNLPLSNVPATLLIDKQGRVAARVVGAISQLTLVQLINDIAAGK